MRLEGTATALGPGDSYSQLAHELHDSRQAGGTVTVLRFAFTGSVDAELTVCHRRGAPWISGAARDARPDEVKAITAAALSNFD